MTNAADASIDTGPASAPRASAMQKAATAGIAAFEIDIRPFSLSNPKFANEVAAQSSELRIRDTSR
jgi:hypothetical protein